MSNWQEVKLGDVAIIAKGKGLPKDDIVETGKYECIHYGELFTKYQEVISNIISRTNNNSDIFTSKTNDVLMPTSDVTPRGLATASCIQKDGVIIGGDVLVIRPQNELDGKFFAYFVAGNKHSILRLTTGSTIFHLYGSDMRKLKLTLPPKNEQQRIVEVLTVWDAYLEKLEYKIALKEQLKKGLMQQLLTAEIRLSGYNQDWGTVRLSEIGDVRTSSVDKLSIAGQKKVGLLNYMDVYKRDHISISDRFQQVTAKEQQIISSNLKLGDILFTPSSETQTDIGHSAVVTEDLGNVLFSYHLIRLRPKNYFLHPRFSAYAFKKREFYLELWKRAQGATRYTLSKDAIAQSIIKIPLSIDEQVAIAEILETIEAEIQYLTTKKNSVIMQKQYLLKNLITGIIRTPEPAATKEQHYA